MMWIYVGVHNIISCSELFHSKQNPTKYPRGLILAPYFLTPPNLITQSDSGLPLK